MDVPFSQRELRQPEQRSPAIADLQKQSSPPPQCNKQSSPPRQSHGQEQPHHEKVKLKEINPYLTCHLCRGYLVDATTISECLHSFCRSCIIKFLEDNSFCPVCEVIINKAKPNLKLDKTLQDIVYKLVPGLFLAEMLRRKRFYAARPGEAGGVSPEQRGEDTERTIFNPQDRISLALEYIGDAATSGLILRDLRTSLAQQEQPTSDSNSKKPTSPCDDVQTDTLLKRYLQCPGMCRIDVIKKFISNKYNVNADLFQIDILYKRVPVPLPDHYTLIDVAYIYTWKRNEPMRFYFRIIEKGNDELPDLTKVFTPIDAPPLLRPQARSTPIKKIPRNDVINSEGKDRKKRTPKKNNAARKVRTPKLLKKEDYNNCDKNTIESETNDKVKTNEKPSAQIENEHDTSDKTQNSGLVNKTKETNTNVIKKESEAEVNINAAFVESDEESDSKPLLNKDNAVKKQVFTNITLNRTNNLEIITKIHKVSDKAGQQIVLNLVNQTVKKSNTVTNNVQNATSTSEEAVTKTDVDNEIPPSLEPEVHAITQELQVPKEKEAPVLKPEVPKKNETASSSNIKGLTEAELEQKKFEFLKSIELTSKKVVDNLAKMMQKQQQMKALSSTTQNPPNKAAVAATSGKPCYSLKAPVPNAAMEILKTKKVLSPKPGTNGVKRKNSSPVKSESKKPKVEPKRTTKIIIQQKPGYPVKQSEIPKISENVISQNKNDLHSLFQNCRLNIPSSLSITLKENGESTRQPLQMPPVQNYIEILKIEEGKKLITLKREDASCLKAPSPDVKKPSELSQPTEESTSVPLVNSTNNICTNPTIVQIPKLTSELPKVSPSGQAESTNKSKDTKEVLTKAQQQQQSFQKIFEESIKKSELESTSTDIDTDNNAPAKRNILEIAQQLHKKSKNDQDAQKNLPKVCTESDSKARCSTPMPLMPIVPKIAIPRLNNQRVVKPPKKKQKCDSVPHQTIKNLHSSSLGLNYTVSVGKQSKDPVQQTYKVNGVMSQPRDSTSNPSNGSVHSKSSPVKHNSNIDQTLMSTSSKSSYPGGGSVSVKSSPISPKTLDLKITPGQQSPKIPKVPHSPKPSIASPAPRNDQVPPPYPNTVSPRNYSAKTPQSSPKPRSRNASPKLAQSAGSSSVSSTSSSALTPNQLLEKYNIQNLAQLSASINFNASAVPQSYMNAVQGTQMAALHQAMMLKQFELQNRQKWLNINQGPLLQFEKYLQSLNASKNQILGNIKDN